MIIFTATIKRIFKQPLNWASLLTFPVLFSILASISAGSDIQSAEESDLYFGLVDKDNTVMSKALANQFSLRYNIIEVDEADISAKLTDQEIPWILKIGEGYEKDVLEKNTALTSLEGYSLIASDYSSLLTVTAENITRALMLLGTNDLNAISAWEDASRVNIEFADSGDAWGILSFWFGFFGFISLFTAYFVVKTLLDDKRQGMPDRVNALPVSARKYLFQGTLATFIATEVTAALTFLVLAVQVGEIPNPLWLFLLLSLYNLFSVSLVLAITSIAKDLGVASVAMTMIATISAMLGGLFWPIEFMPEFMRRIGWFSPGYWLSQGLQNIKEITFGGVIAPLLFLAGFTAVTLLIGGLKKIQRMDDE